jgi:hypothetical protein
MPFSPLSPGVYVTEVDLTTSVPAVSVSTGGHSGIFQWGPALKVTSINNEKQLVTRFGDPDNNTAASFFSCASFLAYSNALQVARAGGTGTNNATSNAATNVVINNEDDYFNNLFSTYVVGNPWTARYPGALGNSLKVVAWTSNAAWVADATNANSPNFIFANQFPFGPNTSPWLTNISGGANTGDELHVIVIDAGGRFTGQANTVLEKYQGLSRLQDSATPLGANNFYHTVLFNKSSYIYSTGIPSSNANGWNIPSSAFVASNSANEGAANVFTLAGGKDGTITTANLQTAWTLFANVEQVDVGLLFTADAGNTLQSFVVQSVAQVRKDAVAFISPPLANTQDVTGQATSIANYANQLNARSSYAVMDSGYKYMYDKYNDAYRWIPLNADIAGLCAQTDNLRDPWWSPAGLQRGTIKNSVKLAYNPGKADRDTLYSAGVNPVVSFPGQGTILFGDKTFLNYASAFDHINVRRLFIVLEKAISQASRTSLFEFNDAFTRSQFTNLITPFLTTVKGRRGITDFKVVCDQTNNTPFIINSNQFVGDIYIVPNFSINFIQLNFVAVQNGVNFNTIIGQF